MSPRARIRREASRFAAVLAASLCAAPMQAQVQDFRPPQFRSSDDLAPYQVLTPAEARGMKIDPAVLADVKQLEDPSFAMREEATKRLLDPSTDKMQLYALLASDQLTSEQRYRLLTVVRDMLLHTPRGAIGISMNQFQAVAGGPIELRVAELIPGLPAEKVLQLNDRITEIDGQPMTMPDELQFRVQSKRPGEKVTLTVKRLKPKDEGPRNEAAAGQDGDERSYETLHVQLELGSAELLKGQRNQFNQMNQPNRLEMTRQLEAAYVARDCAPKSRDIGVRGGIRQWLALSARSGPSATSSDDAVVNTPVNQDPAIQLLIIQRQQVAEGILAEQVARELWSERLSELNEQLGDPNLTREQTVYLSRVIKRFRELMAD